MKSEIINDREILTFETGDECCDIAFGDNPEFELILDEIVDHSRWSVIHYVVVKRVNDGKYFSSGYSLGATESQDERPYEYSDRVFNQVFPKEKIVIEYV